MSYDPESEIRAAIAGTLSRASGLCFDPGGVHIPARHAAASVHLPIGPAAFAVSPADFPALFGAPLVSGCRTVNGWLLLDFTDLFYDALVRRTIKSLPDADFGIRDPAINRMLVLARHGGSGCPRVPSLQRALLLALSAQKSAAAFRRASRAAETMLHALSPRERPALLDKCGALGNALARLLSYAIK